MDQLLNIALLISLDYKDHPYIIKLIDQEEKTENFTHSDVLSHLPEGEMQSYFSEQYDRLISDTSEYDKFILIFTQYQCEGNIYDLFKKRFLLRAEQSIFQKISDSRQVPIKSDFFDSKYEEIYSTTDLYPAFVFFNDYSTSRNLVENEMKRHHQKFEYQVTTKDYLDANYDSIQSLDKENVKLSLIYKNEHQLAFHYAMKHDFDKALGYLKEKDYAYYHVLFEKYYAAGDVRNLKMIFQKLKGFQENDIELKRFKLYFLLENYTICHNALNNYKIQNELDEIVMLSEKIKFRLFLRDPSIIKDIQMAKKKFAHKKGFLYRFALFECVYHCDLLGDKDWKCDPAWDDVELFILENGYQEDLELLEKVSKSLKI